MKIGLGIITAAWLLALVIFASGATSSDSPEAGKCCHNGGGVF